MSFTNLVVRKWNGEDWPERRISLGCKDDGQAVAISPRYAELSVAEKDFEEIAMRVNNHERLVEALREARGQVVELCQANGVPLPMASMERYDDLLATLETEKKGG